MTSGTRPYLSVVATARNDDHGGNLLRRMQTFVNSFIAQCKRHRLDAELVLVEWNPPSERPPLAEALSWPSDLGPCHVRIIQVPAEIHQRYRHADALPLYQMIAKNVGIRRAEGEFILATNIDIIFSDELMKFIAERRLEKGKMYRIDRWDVMSDVPPDAPVEEQLEYCRTHPIRINAREGTFNLTPDGLRALSVPDIAEPSRGIHLGTGWFAVEQQAGERFRWVEDNAEILLWPENDGGEQSLILDLEPGPGVDYDALAIQIFDEGDRLVAETVIEDRCVVCLRLRLKSGSWNLFRLHVVGGGLPVPYDSRILNFRVFHCKLVPLPAALDSPGVTIRGEPNVKHVTRRLWTRTRAVFHMLRAAWSGEEDMRIGVPVSPWFIEKLRLQLDASGLSLIFPFVRKRRSKWKKPVDEEILDAGTRLLWGGSWYMTEHYAGETFRWTQNDAALVLFLPQGPPQHFAMLIEPGPDVGYKPFDLQIRDQWGRTMCTIRVKKRQWVRFSVPWRPGRTQVINLHTEGGGRRPKISGDDRSMVFRVFRCGWRADEKRAASSPAASSQKRRFDIVRPNTGVAWGWGWSPLERDAAATYSRSALNGAEIILRVPEGADAAKTTPVFDLEPGPGIPNEIDLNFRDSEDRVLATVHVKGRGKVALPMRLFPGNFYLFSLYVDVVPQLTGLAPGQPVIRLLGCGWIEAPELPRDPEAARRALSSSTALSDTLAQRAQALAIAQPLIVEAGPVHLHTNGCGDFTLLAREHWFDLRGYPELDMFSMNMDSVFCWAAHHGGAREVVLKDPLRVYHIEHGTGSGWTPEGQAKLFDRIAAKGIPWLDNQEVLNWARTMNRMGVTMIFNLDNWGLATEVLRETVLSPVPAYGANLAVAN